MTETEADNPHAERRAFRAGRVRLAFLTSAGSKALGLIVQFLAIPLAVRSLGPERFGIYMMLFSALVWIDLGRLGIGPGLTRELGLAWNRGERDRERMLFSNAIFLLLAIAAVISAALTLGYSWGAEYIDILFGSSALKYHYDIVNGSIVVGIFLVAQIVFSAGEAARSAYQDDFINNLMNSLANFVSLMLLFGVALFWPTVPAFALAVFGTIALGKGLNLALLLLRSRPYLFPRWRYVQKAEIRPLLGSSLAFWLLQIGTVMMHHLSLVQLGQMIGAGNLAPFALVFRLLQLLSTAVLMISMPLWPAITDATVRGDVEWILRAYRRLIRFATAFSALTAMGIAILGSTLIPLWAGGGASGFRAERCAWPLLCYLDVESLPHSDPVWARQALGRGLCYACGGPERTSLGRIVGPAFRRPRNRDRLVRCRSGFQCLDIAIAGTQRSCRPPRWRGS